MSSCRVAYAMSLPSIGCLSLRYNMQKVAYALQKEMEEGYQVSIHDVHNPGRISWCFKVSAKVHMMFQ